MAPTYSKAALSSAAANANLPESSIDAINVSGRPRNVVPIAEAVDFTDVPLQQSIKRGKAIANPKLEWTDKVFSATAVTVDSTGYNTSVTTIGVATGHAARMQVWEVYRTAAGENILVTAVTSDSNITVVRAQGGTTAAAIAANSTMQRLASAVPENVISPSAVISRGSFYTNYIQQIIRAIQFSDIESNSDTSYLVEDGDEYETEMVKQTVEGARDLERALIMGRAQVASGTGASALPYMMGGIDSFITVNVLAKAGAIVLESDWLALLQGTWSDVGPSNIGKTAYSGIFLKQVVSSWVDGMRRADAMQTRVKMMVDTLENDLGQFQFIPNYHWPTDELVTINPQNYTVLPYKNLDWREVKLSIDGAFRRGHVQGVFTLLATGDRTATKITGASTTRTAYPALQTA
jgi:hypothetical protein